jgi:prepilin-type N-terminal cleavage/methylation domain-containing protein
MTRRKRHGMTLIESLVVIAIIGVLFALLMSGVMSIREAGWRIQSTNNLKQIMLAVHHFADVHGQQLPTTDKKGANSKRSLHAALLPYIEQGQALAALKTNPNQYFVIQTYISPADPSFKSDDVTVSSYAANAQVFKSFPRLPITIPDGTSNTIGFAEHYSYCGVNYFNAFVIFPGLGFWPHPATFAELYDGIPQFGFQVAPRLSDCNPFLAQTPHKGGMLVAVMDGSVRQVSPSITPSTYWGAITPDGGEVLENW